jgi:hypothetical protein
VVENRGDDVDFGAEELLRLLAGHRDASPHHCVDTVVDALADDARHDVVTVAVQPL